jgi:hypothetical protein
VLRNSLTNTGISRACFTFNWNQLQADDGCSGFEGRDLGLSCAAGWLEKLRIGLSKANALREVAAGHLHEEPRCGRAHLAGASRFPKLKKGAKTCGAGKQAAAEVIFEPAPSAEYKLHSKNHLRICKENADYRTEKDFHNEVDSKVTRKWHLSDHPHITSFCFVGFCLRPTRSNMAIQWFKKPPSQEAKARHCLSEVRDCLPYLNSLIDAMFPFS